MVDEAQEVPEIRQVAPYPAALVEIVNSTAYRPGWSLRLVWDKDRGQGSQGATLDILTRGYDSYHVERGEGYGVHHFFPVPPAAYDARSWRRWVFEMLLLVERHEAMEFFRVGGERPFAPSHGPGNDPYIIREIGTEEDRRTSFRGEMNPA